MLFFGDTMIRSGNYDIISKCCVWLKDTGLNVIFRGYTTRMTVSHEKYKMESGRVFFNLAQVVVYHLNIVHQVYDSSE